MNSCFIIRKSSTYLHNYWKHNQQKRGKWFQTEKTKVFILNKWNLGNGSESCEILILHLMYLNSWLLCILSIPFQRYCYSPEQMAICWRKSPSSSMHVVEASQSSFSDSAGVWRGKRLVIRRDPCQGKSASQNGTQKSSFVIQLRVETVIQI